MKLNWPRLAWLFILLLSIAAPAAAEERGSLSLTFAGDIMAHDVNFRVKDFDRIYDAVRAYLGTDDLSFGNLEFPVVEDRPFSGYPTFNVHLDYVRAAIRAGFDVFSLANNHTRDQGELGALKTLASLVLLKEETGGLIHYAGVRGDPAKPFAPEEILRNGFKIGFLSVTQFLNIGQAKSYVHVVDYRNKQAAARFIAWVKEIAPRYDLLVLSYHGDSEFDLRPNPDKQAFFRALVRAGVHIVWGHHPHVVQPFEWIEAGGSRRLIMYSLGNFVSGMGIYYGSHQASHRLAFTADAFMLSVRVTRRSGGGIELAMADPFLIASYLEPGGQIVVKRLDDLAETKLPGTWQEYYRERLRLVKKFLTEMPSYLVKEKP